MLISSVGIKTTYVVQQRRRAKIQISLLPYALFFLDMRSFSDIITAYFRPVVTKGEIVRVFDCRSFRLEK